MIDNIVNRIEKSEVSVADLSITKIEWIELCSLFEEDFYNELIAMPNEERAHVLVEKMNDKRLVQMLFSKFGTFGLRSDVIRSIYAFGQTHGIGYTLKPHVDSYPRVFNMVFHFAVDDNAPEAGTAIYDIKNFETKEYKTYATAKYLRNSATVLCLNTHSWHGVDMLMKDIKRDSVVVVFSAEEWNENQIHYAEWKPGITVNYEKV